MTVKNRLEMASLLNDRMNKTYSTLYDRQKLEIDTNLVKTYLLEAHTLLNKNHDEILEKILSGITAEGLKLGNKIHIRESHEENFFILSTKIKTENVTIYIDATNPRFWILHSMESSNSVDTIYERITNYIQDYDNIWFPPQYLEAISSKGKVRGISLDYDYRYFDDEDIEYDDTSVEFMKMQLWGNQAFKVLDILREKNAFPNSTTLSKVKIKYSVLDEDEYSIDDIKYNGKITSRGTSFNTHINLINEIYSLYEKNVLHIEDNYSIGFSEEQGSIGFQGESINFHFNKPIKNIKKFCDSVFSCSYPFKLWGSPVTVNPKYYLVRGFDLHVGMPLDFEITNEYIRMYLPKGTCGNTVFRFYTNIQHYYNSQVNMTTGDNKNVVRF